MLINAIVKLVKNIVGGKCRGGVPELDVTEPVPGPRVDDMFAPTARGANTAPNLLEPADCWMPADAWCLGFVSAREPKLDCCGVVSFAYARLCATSPCGTRTRNLRIRSPTPCPLGQGSRCIMYMSSLVHCGERGNHSSQTVGAGGAARAKKRIITIGCSCLTAKGASQDT